MSLPILFKMDSKGKVREWKVIVKGDTFIVEHGLKDGAKQTQTTTCTGKNIGKSNETTPQCQAYLEAQSKWKKQLDKGYSETIQATSKAFLPMLAHKFNDHKSKVKYPVYVQPKYNGIRSNIRLENGEVKIYSRRNKDFTACLTHIVKAMTDILEENPSIVFDGELYSHELTLQDIASAVKRDTPNDLSSKIQFYCYDLYDANEPYITFFNRVNLLPALIYNQDSIKLAPTIQANNEKSIFLLHHKMIQEGYEGSIIRSYEGIYKVDGRSYDLLKLKDFMDDEFKIVGQKIDKNKECVFTCTTEAGNEFDVKIRGTREYRQGLTTQDLTGKMLTVRFFEWTPTDKPVPFHGVGLEISDYE